MPNTLAYVVLFCWPIVVFVLFRRLPLPVALVWSILAGYLFLPPQTGIDLPLLPPLDKATVPSFSAAVMCLLQPRPRGSRRRVAQTARPAAPAMRGLVAACLVLLAGAIALTVRNNGDGIYAGPGRVLTALRTYDLGSMALDAAVMLLPFLLARRHLADREAQVVLLRALVAAGLAYSAFILIEIRLSPQLNRWIYGFHAHQFAQQIRFGGFRATVFIEHGLRVSLFIAMAVLASAALLRSDAPQGIAARRPAGDAAGPGAGPARKATSGRGLGIAITVWLFVVLFLTKSVGAFVIALVLLPMVLLLSSRMQVLIAATLAAVVLVYPMLRGSGLVPTETLVGWAAGFEKDRADSLQFRFDNEDILLDRANERPLAGWGGFGRNRVFDPQTGQDLSITDGTWVIYMGTNGWLGYLARFGLLTLPILLLARRGSIDRATAGLALVLAANLVDLIPNSGLSPVTWMLAGALSAYRPQHDAAPHPARRRQRRPAGGGAATA